MREMSLKKMLICPLLRTRGPNKGHRTNIVQNFGYKLAKVLLFVKFVKTQKKIN